MKRSFSCLTIIAFIVLAGFTGKHHDEVVNYYGTPESLKFGSLTYTLSWSSHPTDVYYKHEYIPKGNSVERYKDMVMIDFTITDLTVQQAVAAQIAVINERKITDALCNYQVLKNSEKPDDYILDFTMSENITNSTMLNAVEWDAYHYKAYTDTAGHRGILLFGISHRTYFGETWDFLKSLRKYRDKNIKLLTEYAVPEIQVK